ncbi:MAG: YggT family protein [Anaerosomatales bacterium]|nr:YggT family protein [Anaerosomatales bacterium]
MSLAALVSRLIDFYVLLIFIYIIMSWFRPTGFLYDIYRVLAQVCEPYIGIFRRLPLQVGMLDLSPMAAIFVLYLIQRVLVRILWTAGL